MSTIPIPTGGPPPPGLDKYQLLEEEYHRVRDELTQARATIENYDRELKRRNEKLREASQYIDHLQHENQRLKDSMNGLQRESESNEVQGKELLGSQVFLTKVNALSISEVGEKVTALNEEIFQAAATLGEALKHKRHKVSQIDLDVSREMVGEKMMNILITESQKPEPEVNALLVEVVLQIFLVRFCVSKIQSWYPGDSAIGGFLSALYSKIRSTEEQAVSGRWRALTRAHTRPSTETWKKQLYDELVTVFFIASWTPCSSERQKSFGNRLLSIFKAINELRMAIGENFASADLDIFVFECDKIFDPAIMVDEYGGGKRSSGKRAPEAIIGTTGIGLRKVTADRSAKDVHQDQIVTPAKIVLWSTLNEALEPIQSSSRLKTKKKPVENMDGANQDGRD